MSYEEEDTSIAQLYATQYAYEEEDTCHMRRRIQVLLNCTQLSMHLHKQTNEDLRSKFTDLDI
jgi:hypothetical protein